MTLLNATRRRVDSIRSLNTYNIRIKIARLSERVVHRYDFAQPESDGFSHPMNYGNCD